MLLREVNESEPYYLVWSVFNSSENDDDDDAEVYSTSVSWEHDSLAYASCSTAFHAYAMLYM